MKKNNSFPIFIPMLIIFGVIVVLTIALSNFNPPVKSVEVVISNERFKN